MAAWRFAFPLNSAIANEIASPIFVAPPVTAESIESIAVFVTLWSEERLFASWAVSEKVIKPDWSCDFKLSKNDFAAAFADSILEGAGAVYAGEPHWIVSGFAKHSSSDKLSWLWPTHCMLESTHSSSFQLHWLWLPPSSMLPETSKTKITSTSTWHILAPSANAIFLGNKKPAISMLIISHKAAVKFKNGFIFILGLLARSILLIKIISLCC